MTKTEVLDLLKENRDARGEANWQAVGDRTGGLTSFGIGLTKLRAIAKQVGCDHHLALTLWNERNHDAKIIGLLIDDPKELTRDQVENRFRPCSVTHTDTHQRTPNQRPPQQRCASECLGKSR